MTVIRPIVEGHGEVSALPELLRRLCNEAQAWGLQFARPHRYNRSQMVRKDALQKFVRLALLDSGCQGVLILLDADDDCPRDRAPLLEQWAREVAGGKACAVVMAKREYEAWFLASIEALRGTHGILPSATSHPDPESPRDAKGELERRMSSGFSYSPTVDQARLTARLDLRRAYQRCRSFRKLVTSFGSLAAAAGEPIAVWPPPDWTPDDREPCGDVGDHQRS